MRVCRKILLVLFAMLFVNPILAAQVRLRVEHWFGMSHTHWDHNLSGLPWWDDNDVFYEKGPNPGSELTYSDMGWDMVALVLNDYFYGPFFNELTAGLSWHGNGGRLYDKDFDPDGHGGVVLWSSTISELKRNRVNYYALKFGRSFYHPLRWLDVISPYLGYMQYRESTRAYGVDDLLGFYDDDDIEDTVAVIGNVARWQGLMVGLMLEKQLVSRLSLVADMAYLPGVRLRGSDSHYLRSDLGPVPNALFRATGEGYSARVGLDMAITPHWKIGGAYRYLHFHAHGAIIDQPYAIEPVSLYLNRYVTKASAALVSVTYTR